MFDVCFWHLVWFQQLSVRSNAHARKHVQAGWFRDDLTVGGPFNEGETVVKASSRLSPGSQRANQLAQEERNFSC